MRRALHTHCSQLVSSSLARASSAAVRRREPWAKPAFAPRGFGFRATSPFLHMGPSVDKDTATEITIKWVKGDADSPDVQETKCYVGQTLLQVAHMHDIELEGACEGVCACSTCHTILTDDLFDELEPPSEEEEDMLDMAFGLEETSRLGCQVVLTEGMDGVEFRIPAATRNFYVDGHVPKPH